MTGAAGDVALFSSGKGLQTDRMCPNVSKMPSRYQKKIQSQTARATDTTASRTLRITIFSGAGRSNEDSAVSNTRPTASPKPSRACDLTGSVQNLLCNCVATGLVARSGRQRIMVDTISSMPQPVNADTMQTG